MKSSKTYPILWIVLFCPGFPSKVSGQYIRKETVGGKTYAVIYTDGLVGVAQWGTGVKMMRNGVTIRHQVSKGNGENLSVNDRISFRFIVTTEDAGDSNKNWMIMQGVNDGGQDQNPDFTITADTGCRRYGAAGASGAGRKWRVPTQRELQLMRMFREPIGLIYKDKPIEEPDKTKRYWSSTEKGTDQAWSFDFASGVPYYGTQAKSMANGMVRCVSDYQPIIKMNIEIPNLAIDKESQNLYYIYLFYVEDKWCAFGYSAYYLSIMYPVLEAANETTGGHEACIPCIHVPDSSLVRLSEFYSTSVSDSYIQVEAPPTAYCYQLGYDEWYEKLAVN